MPNWEVTEAHLRWDLAIEVVPTKPGEARLEIVAANALVGRLAFSGAVDWRAGYEIADVAARPLGIFAKAFERLSDAIILEGRRLAQSGQL